MSHKDDGQAVRSTPNKPARGRLKRHPSLQARLRDIKEVKKLHISEEKFSYYDEFKTFELGVVKTQKPQFMYDAAAARARDQERESRARYEAIRRHFWRMWAPTGSDDAARKPAKVFAAGKSRLRPYDLDLVRASNPGEATALLESSEMYKEAVNRAALDAIEFAANLCPSSTRMTRLPRLIKSLKTNIALSEKQPTNLFVQASETSSIENVKEWVKHLNPYTNAPEGNRRTSIAPRRGRMSLQQNVRMSKVFHVRSTRGGARRGGKGKRKPPRGVTGRLLGNSVEGEAVGVTVVEPVDGTVSTISMEQLLTFTTHSATSDTASRRKMNVAKRALELQEEIEMVKNLPVISPSETPEARASCRIDPFQVDPTQTKHWQERRLYYQRQEGIDYNINFHHPCLQRLNFVQPKKRTRRTLVA